MGLRKRPLAEKLTFKEPKSWSIHKPESHLIHEAIDIDFDLPTLGFIRRRTAVELLCWLQAEMPSVNMPRRIVILRWSLRASNRITAMSPFNEARLFVCNLISLSRGGHVHALVKSRYRLKQ